MKSLESLQNYKKHLAAGLLGSVLTLGLGASAITFAQTAPTTSGTTTTSQSATHMPGVAGTVTAVSGNTITITDKDGTTYTVDAGSAAITKDQTVTVSSIAVGDTIMAGGTVNGTSVAATTIHDGQMPMGGFGGHGRGHGIHGTVTSVSGNTLTITATNPDSSTTSTYTVDATNAKVLKGDGTTAPAASTLSAVVAGDQVMVDGTVSGTSVTANTIIDGPMPAHGLKTSTTTSTTTQ